MYKLKSIANSIKDTMDSVFNPSSWLTSSLVKSAAAAAAPVIECANEDPSSLPGGKSRRRSHPNREKRRVEQCPVEIPDVPLNSGRRIDFMLQVDSISFISYFV